MIFKQEKHLTIIFMIRINVYIENVCTYAQIFI